MSRPLQILGRETVARQVRDLLAAGRSVLLFGPEAIGKTAIIRALAPAGVTIVDPFERIGRLAASDMRRALDRGAVFLAASRVPHGRQLGAVGRILWRFSLVRVRELPDAVMRRIVTRELGKADRDADDAWRRQIVALSRGRPGFAIAMGRFARDWHAARGYLPLAALAFAATREDTVIHALRGGTAASAGGRGRRR